MHPELFTLFGFPVRAYGAFMTLAHLAGIALFLRTLRGRELGPYIDLMIATVIAGLVGARLGYALVHRDEFTNPWRLLALDRGGLAFFGGLALAFPAFCLVLRRHRLPIFATADLVSPIVAFSLGLLRIGCFLQGCCYGAPTELPWAVVYGDAHGEVPPALSRMPLHPTQLYEAAFLFALSCALFRARARAPGHVQENFAPGSLATAFILAYASYRFVMDFLRADLERGFLGLDWLAPTQAAALVALLAVPVAIRKIRA